eukprot:23185-Chlamydomonas_euryale.AAC.5
MDGWMHEQADVGLWAVRSYSPQPGCGPGVLWGCVGGLRDSERLCVTLDESGGSLNVLGGLFCQPPVSHPPVAVGVLAVCCLILCRGLRPRAHAALGRTHRL